MATGCAVDLTTSSAAVGGIFRWLWDTGKSGSQDRLPLGWHQKLQPTDMAMCMQFDAAATARSANVAAELEAALGEATAARAEMVRWRGDASAVAAACDEVDLL